MKKHYDGLEAVVIPLNSSDITATSPGCIGTIMNVLENGICVSDEEHQFIEYYGKDDPNW